MESSRDLKCHFNFFRDSNMRSVLGITLYSSERRCRFLTKRKYALDGSIIATESMTYLVFWFA
jgi:hypothetical protein